MTQRPSARQRNYDSRWDRARAEFLAANPRCVVCGGAVKVTSHRGDPLLGVVHHKIPHRGDWKLFWNRRNWRTVHKQCHDGPLQSAERTGRERGCDESGVPLDAGHHWKRARVLSATPLAGPACGNHAHKAEMNVSGFSA